MKMGMDILGMSDGQFKEQEPSIVQSLIEGDHMDILVNLPQDELATVAQLIGVKNGSLKDVKHAVKKLNGDKYQQYVTLLTSLDKQK